MLKILFPVFVLLNGICFGQMPKWIQAKPCVNDQNQLIPPSTNSLHFYEVDFTGPTPVFTQRNEGLSITGIQTSGVNEVINNGIDANGNVSFYVFAETAQPFMLGAQANIHFAAFNPATGQDDIFAVIFGYPTNASSVKNIEVVPKEGSPNMYYVIYKTACVNNLSPDMIQYVTVDMNTRSISASTTLSSNSNNEGMGISRRDCASNKRWFFFSKFSNGSVSIYRSEITATAVSVPVLVTSVNVDAVSLGQGDLEISPDGTKLAIAMMATNSSATEDVLLFDLNLSTGALSNYRWIDNPLNYILSMEFSPDSQRLYLARTGSSAISNVIYNVQVPNGNYTIQAADQLNTTLNPGLIMLEIGFDQKIYFNTGNSIDRLSFVSNPNDIAANNIISQTPANSYGVGNRAGYAFPDQVDGDIPSSGTTISLSADQQTICVGQSATLVTSGGSNYVWSNGLTGSGSTQVVTPASTTTYYVNSSGACGNATDSITIFVVENPIAAIVGDQEICEGESITLLGSGATDFFWNGSTTAGQNSITLNPSGSTVYSLIVSNGSCSSGSMDFPVTVHPKPQLELIGDLAWCEGETAMLSASVSSGTAPFTYNWSDGSVDQVNTFVPSNEQELTVIVNDQSNCADTVTVQMEVEPQPTANFFIQEEGCSPHAVFIQNESMDATDFIWHYGDGTLSSTTDGTHTYEAGTYSVSLIALNAIGCADTLTLENAVNVLISPNASFTINGIDPSNPTYVELINQSSVADSCVLYFGDGTLTTDCDWNVLAHTYPAEDVYTVTQVLTNESGCSDTATYQLNLYGEIIFYVPNAFTPDGNEANNVFSVVLSDLITLEQFKFTIFDRWGELIFETTNHFEGWDGTYRNQLAKDGIYTWKLHLDDGKTESREFTGHVSLLR